MAEVPRVVTDIPPVHALVAQVMGDLGQPVLLLAKGADEHDFALKPSQMGDIADAGLVVWIGPELTPWLDRALQGSSAAQLALLDAPGTQTRPYAPGEDDEHEEGEAEDHDHGSINPHAWLDPGNAAVWLALIAADLARIDPENAATYAANADTARAQLTALDAEVTALLAPVKDKPFVTFHAAYGYFTAHYGMNPAPSLALGDAAAPGAARVAELQAQVAADHITCLFPEAQHDPALLTVLTEGTGATLGGALDPVGSSYDPGPDAYAAILKGIATTLAGCLKG
jgi:zinc transport system substrate-binding protein